MVQETLHFDPPHGAAQLAALQGGGARLPLLPRARPRAGRADARRCWPPRARRCPSCRPRAPRATSATGRWRRTPRGCSPTSRSWGDYFEAVAAADGGGATARRRPTGSTRPARAPRRRGRPGARRRRRPAALARLVGLVARRQVSAGAARQVLDRLVAEGGEPGRDRRARGARRDGRRRRARRASSAAAIAANADAAEKVRAGNDKAMGPIVGHVMRETKGRADGGEVRRLIREQLGL